MFEKCKAAKPSQDSGNLFAEDEEDLVDGVELDPSNPFSSDFDDSLNPFEEPGNSDIFEESFERLMNSLETSEPYHSSSSDPPSRTSTLEKKNNALNSAMEREHRPSKDGAASLRTGMGRSSRTPPRDSAPSCQQHPAAEQQQASKVFSSSGSLARKQGAVAGAKVDMAR